MASSNVNTTSTNASSTDALAMYRQTTTNASKNDDPNGENRFLTVLMAQMQNQDPLNPMDNAQVTSQLAQINTVKGIQGLNDSFAKLSESITGNQLLGATSMIGRSMLVEGSGLTFDGTNSVTAGVKLPSDASQVSVNVVDASGRVVDTIHLSDATAGTHMFQWDGTKTDGSAAPAGSYRLDITASAGTAAVDATAMVTTRIQGLSRDSSGVTLSLSNGNTVPLADANQIL